MSIFDIITLLETESTPWNELSPDVKKAYNQFMINRFISSKKQYIPLLAKMATLQLTDEQHYTLLQAAIVKQRHYFDYKAYKKTEETDKLAIFALEKQFNIGPKDAERYLEFISAVELDAIIKNWRAYYEQIDNK